MYSRLKLAVMRLAPTEWRFAHIYRTNSWGSPESISGPGSEMAATATLRKALLPLFEKFEIGSVLDAPCGDFNWMREIVEESRIRYVGMDIVRPLVVRNGQKYGRESVEFRHGDIIQGPVPKVDLILNRDCFIHFSFADTASTMRVFKQSASRWLLANTYPDVEHNYDIVTGDFRRINLMREPYNFPEPVLRISESKPGKEMALWELKDL